MKAINIVGMLVSLAFMFATGRNNPSIVLMSLFFLWVSSPFVALLLLQFRLMITKTNFTYATLIFSIGSPIAYAINYFSPGKTPAFIFLMIPLISWVIILILFLVGRRKRP